MNNTQNKYLEFFLVNLEQRKRHLPKLFTDHQQTIRLIHDKDNGYYCDKLGDVLWFYRFKKTDLSSKELAAIKEFTNVCNCSIWHLREMENRGKNPHLKEQNSNSWEANEGKSKYLFRTDSGWSPGLFLDQRKNRQWTLDNTKNKRVLNLFCYTAGFSLQAALGKASEVVSVDSSQQTLNWAKENFALNQLNSENYEFWKADALFFLKGCAKKNRQFDLIICDPPSFSRGKTIGKTRSKGKANLFTIEKNGEELIHLLLDCLAPKGTILFSSNFEKWNFEKFSKQIKFWTKSYSTKKPVQITPAHPPDKDFSVTKESLQTAQQSDPQPNQQALTKSFFITLH